VALKRTKFDPKQNKVVFLGEVQLDDPRFALRSDALTAYLKKGEGSPKKTVAPGGEEGVSAKPNEEASKGALELQQSGGGLESAEAEGNVEIVQERVNPEGKMERNVIRARKAVYVSATETMTLTGWPQVLQAHNGNMLKALREDTVMVLNKSGDVDVHGPAKSVFVNPGKNGK
jgi:lipopolysaccharide export system protein LptA